MCVLFCFYISLRKESCFRRRKRRRPSCPRRWQLNCITLSSSPSKNVTKTSFWTTGTWALSPGSCWRMKACSFWKDFTWRGTRSRRWYPSLGFMCPLMVHVCLWSPLESHPELSYFVLLWDALIVVVIPSSQPDNLAQKLPNLIELWVSADPVCVNQYFHAGLCCSVKHFMVYFLSIHTFQTFNCKTVREW